MSAANDLEKLVNSWRALETRRTVIAWMERHLAKQIEALLPRYRKERGIDSLGAIGRAVWSHFEANHCVQEVAEVLIGLHMRGQSLADFVSVLNRCCSHEIQSVFLTMDLERDQLHFTFLNPDQRN